MTQTNTDNDLVILVDKNDKPIGSAPKLMAHQQGLLHRAFSIFVYRQTDNETEWLLQQRQMGKYHSQGLWTNTCCSHPRIDESLLSAAQRRLQEEMGITQLMLHEVACFHYRAELDHDLFEHEIDHVFIAKYNDQAFKPNPDEVMNYRWATTTQLQQELASHPEKFTAWFEQVLEQVRLLF